MTELPLHPSIVHLPLGIALVLPLLAGTVWIAWVLGWLPRRSWWLVVLLQAVVWGSGIAAQNTGEHDEELVERVAPESAIETHEERAKWFVRASGGLLLLMVGAGAIPRESMARMLAAGATVGTLATAGLGVATGHAGGELVYRHQAASAHVPPGDLPPAPAVPYAHGEHDEHD